MDLMTTGRYVAQRLAEMGLSDYFAIPGDFNLALLDELLKEPRLRMISCCNELNAGYAADGYARSRGAAALVVTYGVGALAAVSAVAGSYAEDLPVLVIVGGPNTHAVFDHRILHHTLGRPEGDDREVLTIFQSITAHAVVIRNAEAAALHIDQAIRIALAARKPVYLEIACNLAGAPISAPHPLDLHPQGRSGQPALEPALDHVAAFLDRARQPVLVAGSRLRSGGGVQAFAGLASACGYGVACMPNAKGFFPETSPQFMGIYWGSAGSSGCREVVESSDACLFAGPVFNDNATVGFSSVVDPARRVDASPDHIVLEGQSYHGIHLPDFLAALAGRLNRNGGSLEAWRRLRASALPVPSHASPDAPITTRVLYHHLNGVLEGNTTVVAETGDAWFNGMDLRLPEGCRFEVQMQYGSIGWSVGAFLGLAAAGPHRRILGLIGDGAFQMSAQELSTVLRLKLPGLIVLLNNGGYTIEASIHDGPYNRIQNWHYVRLAEALQDQGQDRQQVLALVVRTEADLLAALAKRKDFPGLTFLEVILDRKDCSKGLPGWGTALADFNAGRRADLPCSHSAMENPGTALRQG